MQKYIHINIEACQYYIGILQGYDWIIYGCMPFWVDIPKTRTTTSIIAKLRNGRKNNINTKCLNHDYRVTTFSKSHLTSTCKV